MNFPEHLWTRADRLRVREMHRRGEPMTPEEVLVYKRDRERRKEKLQQKQQPSSAASGAGSAVETPRGAHGTSVTTSVEMSTIGAAHTPPAAAAAAAAAAASGAPLDVRSSPALSYEQRVGQPGSGHSSPAGAGSRGSPAASATGSRPVSIRAGSAAAAAASASAGARTVTYDTVPLQEVVGAEGIGAGEVMVTTVESSNALVPDKAGAGADGNDSDDGSLSLPVPAGFHAAGASGPDSAATPTAFPTAGAGHDAFPSAASAGRSAAASALPSRGSRVMAASQLQEVVSELFKFHDHSQSRNLTMVTGRCACIKRLRRRLQVYSQRRRDPNPLFRASLKEIDGHYGSSIVSFFVFSRWLIMLNIGLALLWLLFIILPFVIVYDYRKWADELTSVSSVAFSLFAGEGLEDTWMFYGGYPFTVSWYHYDVAYAVVAVMAFVVSLIGIMRRIRTQLLGGQVSLVRRDQKLPFALLLFNAWDHSLTDEDAAKNLRAGLNQRMREMVAEEQHRRKLKRRKPFKEVCKRLTIRIVSFVITFALMGAGVYAITQVVTYRDIIASSFFLGEFTLAAVVSVINVLVPFLVKTIARIEAWGSPKVALYLTLARIYISKMANIVYLMFDLYTKAGTLQCPENVLGQTFWRLIVTDFVVSLAASVLGELAFFLLSKLRRLPDPRGDFDLAQSIIDIIYRQALVWIGMIWCPVLPVFAVISNIVLFYASKWVLFGVQRPPIQAWDFSRSGNFFFTLLALTLVACIAPLCYFFARTHAFHDCGPHSLYTSGAQAVLQAYIDLAPAVAQQVIYWIFNPLVLVGIIIVLAIVMYFLSARINQYSERLGDTTGELRNEQKEKRMLLSQLRAQIDQLHARRAGATRRQGATDMSAVPNVAVRARAGLDSAASAHEP